MLYNTDHYKTIFYNHIVRWIPTIFQSDPK